MPNECESCGDVLSDKRFNTRGLFGNEVKECEDCRRMRVCMKRAHRQRIGAGSASDDLASELNKI